MLYLKTFESYSIKKMYFINEYDVNNTLPYTYPSLYKHKLYSVYDHIYTQYKKGVSHKSTASFNYIYETGNLNLFDFYHIKKLNNFLINFMFKNIYKLYSCETEIFTYHLHLSAALLEEFVHLAIQRKFCMFSW